MDMDNLKTIVALGTFPVTQQVVGVAFLAYNLAKAVENIAKLAFYNIKKSFEKSDFNGEKLEWKIMDTKSDLKQDAKLMGLSLFMMIPILGSISCGMIWKGLADKQKRQKIVQQQFGG